MKNLLVIFLVVLSTSTVTAISERDRKIIEQMPIVELMKSILSVSWDLRKYDKYHCYYDPSEKWKACQNMQTVSGQYEDFYQSTMTACDQSELCPGASLNISSWTYIQNDQRICKQIETKSCVKELIPEQKMRQELIELLEFKEQLEQQ